mmetsp:Transcript_40632/g.95487  ORF Transcript_40632/g.95487 Transcript_40632/m.95487 type:complete len:262 (-) Transcript_40632:1422-2207(-)
MSAHTVSGPQSASASQSVSSETTAHSGPRHCSSMLGSCPSRALPANACFLITHPSPSSSTPSSAASPVNSIAHTPSPPTHAAYKHDGGGRSRPTGLKGGRTSPQSASRMCLPHVTGPASLVMAAIMYSGDHGTKRARNCSEESGEPSPRQSCTRLSRRAPKSSALFACGSATLIPTRADNCMYMLAASPLTPNTGLPAPANGGRSRLTPNTAPDLRSAPSTAAPLGSTPSHGTRPGIASRATVTASPASAAATDPYAVSYP